MKRLWYILTTRCAEADRLRSIAAIQPLTGTERTAMRLHQMVCKSCRIAARQIETLDRALERFRALESAAEPAGPGLSPEARERIRAALSQSEK